MGKIVLGLAAPHNPNITSRPDKMSPEVQSKLDSAFGHLKKGLSEASPDCLLILTSDHVTNFFYNNAPMFCLGVSDTCTGPAPKEMAELRIPRATLKVDTTMAKGLLNYGIESGIDFSYSQEMILDHAFMVPLSLLTPHMDLPIVPLHINGMLPPRPTAGTMFPARPADRGLHAQSLQRQRRGAGERQLFRRYRRTQDGLHRYRAGFGVPRLGKGRQGSRDGQQSHARKHSNAREWPTRF